MLDAAGECGIFCFFFLVFGDDDTNHVIFGVGIELKDKIVIVRYGGIFRGSKVCVWDCYLCVMQY